MQWTRTKKWATVGLLVLAATTVVIAGTTGARGDGRWPADFPTSVWTGATWQEATVAERRIYVLGITDGLRLAAVFNQAQVNLNPVAQCVQRMSPRCTSTSGMPSSRCATTTPGTNEAPWSEDLQEYMDNGSRSGVGLSALGRESYSVHHA